ncbi:hypothetical protein ADEAN_000563400 [Angomonas deanei]|uniref:Uncharacterized protein n=1 Tax=Angomonas deanei TaxID=59799 RepID=A0A7G2CGI2_9TRYP|nr:hypothetical protein ADEAN_000563400 [Angomonas deanei]
MSSRDTFVVLQYISRELKRIDRELHQNNHHNKTEYASYDIEKCKIGLANLTLQRITFFFTATNQNNNNNTKDRDPHGAFLGSAEDALAALETLLNINVESYADPNQWELFLKHSNNHNNQNVTEETEKTRMLVAHLMTCIMQHKVELRFTSLVQAFSLTRIYLSILYPYPQLVQQKSLLLRWSWSLARALYVRDKYFVNSYHFVKIINALARFPAYTLAPSRVGTNPHYHNKNKNENNGVEEEIREFQRSMQQREHQEMHSNNTTNNNNNNNGITAEEFWDFLVSKAIIFILQNRQDETFIRNICVPLYICIEERRGQFFNHHENEKVSEQILKPLALECGTLYDMILIEYKKQKSNKSTGGGGRGRERGNRPARQYGNRPQRHYPHHNNRNDRRNKK